MIPIHQFGFRNKQSTIDRVRKITNIIEKILEEKKVCFAIFLDVTEVFDKSSYLNSIRIEFQYIRKII